MAFFSVGVWTNSNSRLLQVNDDDKVYFIYKFIINKNKMIKCSFVI